MLAQAKRVTCGPRMDPCVKKLVDLACNWLQMPKSVEVSDLKRKPQILHA